MPASADRSFCAWMPALLSRLPSLLLLALLLALLLGACATDTIEDRRFGQQVVCHDGHETLTVSNADSFVHLNHGDTPGPCPDD